MGGLRQRGADGHGTLDDGEALVEVILQGRYFHSAHLSNQIRGSREVASSIAEEDGSGKGKTEMRNWKGEIGQSGSAANEARAASTVRTMSSSVWAAETNIASNCEGARNTPRPSMPP